MNESYKELLVKKDRGTKETLLPVFRRSTRKIPQFLTSLFLSSALALPKIPYLLEKLLPIQGFFY